MFGDHFTSSNLTFRTDRMLAQEVLEWPLDGLHDQETLAMGMKKEVTSFSGNVIGSEFPMSGLNKWINFIEHLQKRGSPAS